MNMRTLVLLVTIAIPTATFAEESYFNIVKTEVIHNDHQPVFWQADQADSTDYITALFPHSYDETVPVWLEVGIFESSLDFVGRKLIDDNMDGTVDRIFEGTVESQPTRSDQFTFNQAIALLASKILGK